MYEYKKHTKLNKVLIEQWEELEKSAYNSTLMNTYKWFLAAESLGKTNGAEFHTCYKDGKLAAIVVLTISKKYGIPVKAPILDQYIIETPVLIQSNDPELITCLLSNISTNSNVYLPKVDEGIAKAFKKAWPKGLVVLMAASPYVDNANVDPFKDISRSNMRYITKIRRKYGDKLVSKHYNENDNLEELLPILFEIDIKSSKSSKNKSIFTSNENKKFYTSFVKVYRDNIRICVTYADNVPVGYIFGVVYKNKYIDYQTSYLKEYKQYAPGKMTVFSTLEKVRNSEYTCVDFCAGMASYKLEFTSKYALQYDYLCSASKAVTIFWRMVIKLGRLKKKLIPEKYTRDPEFLFKTL